MNKNKKNITKRKVNLNQKVDLRREIQLNVNNFHGLLYGLMIGAIIGIILSLIFKVDLGYVCGIAPGMVIGLLFDLSRGNKNK